MYEKLVELLREAADSIETQDFQRFHNELEQVKRERDELEKGLSLEKELCSFYKDVADRAMEQCKKKIDERDHLKKERDAAVADLEYAADNPEKVERLCKHFTKKGCCIYVGVDDLLDDARIPPCPGFVWRGLEGRED